MNGTIQKIAERLVQSRFSFAFVSILLVLGMSSGLGKLGIEANERAFFAKDNPYLVSNDNLEAEFTDTNSIAFLLTVDRGDLFTRERLEFISAITKEAWSLPYAVRVDSLSNFQNTTADGDELLVNDLYVDAQSMSAIELSEIRNLAIANDQLLKKSVAVDGKATLIVVLLAYPDEATTADTEVVKAARQMMEQFDADAAAMGLSVQMVGSSVITNAFNEVIEADNNNLTPLVFLLSFLGIGLFLFVFGLTYFNAFMISIFVALIVILSIAASLGVGANLGYKINTINVVTPTILLTISVASCIHLLMSFVGTLRLGQDKLGAMTTALTKNIYPVFITSLTTALGVLGLNFSDIPPFRSLGNMVFVGIFSINLLLFAFLPAMVSLLPCRLRSKAMNGKPWNKGWASWLVTHNGKLALITGVMTLLAILPIRHINMDDNIVEYFDDSLSIKKAFHTMEERLTGHTSIYYSLDSGSPGGINNPAFLQDVAKLQEWYLTQENVVAVDSYLDVIKRLNRDMHEGEAAYYRIPESQELASQYMLVYEMSLPQGLDLNTLANMDKSKLRLRVIVKEQDASGLINLEQNAAHWIVDNLHHLKASPGSGKQIMFAHLGRDNARSMMKGNLYGLIIITVVLGFVFGSWRLGLLTIVPNLTPALVAVGIWVLFGNQVNLSVAMVYIITLGIVVDDTVHMTSHYLTERRKPGANARDSMVTMLSQVGAPVVLSSVVLMVGFSVLTLSLLKLNVTLGSLVASTVVIALAFDLLVLPALLLAADRWLFSDSGSQVVTGTEEAGSAA